ELLKVGVSKRTKPVFPHRSPSPSRPSLSTRKLYSWHFCFSGNFIDWAGQVWAPGRAGAPALCSRRKEEGREKQSERETVA
ncbi:hypothetical protein LEMLEM_LOCUS23687, partial [Lemmus lemmus]